MRLNPTCLQRSAASALALAMASLAAPAAAQSYAAPDPTVASGIVTYNRSIPGQETYTINSPRAVIDFVPNDTGVGGGAIAFQPAGTSVTYQNGTGTSNFTILNRIVPVDPTRPIQFDGTVISQLTSGGPAVRGGAVWFYSPGGVIVGATGVFDVGSLLLSSGDPTGGSGTISSDTSFTISSTPDSGAAVRVMPGGQITASPNGSYIALVAPSVVQQGTVSSNGGVAYVAAEQATLSFTSGLIDIQTTVGSNANFSQPLVHEGTTRFIDDSAPRAAYLVAVPKNDAITMVIGAGSQLGFDTATGVTVANGSIFLTGDHDIVGSTGTSYRNSGFATNLLVLGGTFNADAYMYSGSGSFLQSDSALSFAGDLDIYSQQISSILSTNADLTIAGDLTAHAIDSSGQGGSVLLGATGVGNLTLGSAASTHELIANSTALNPTQDVAGGTVNIIANGGNVNIAGGLQATATANGGTLSSGTAGTATGGSVAFIASGGSAVNVGGDLLIQVDGLGAQGAGTAAASGSGQGGSASFFAQDGQIGVGGSVTVLASGRGGNLSSGSGQAGSGLGGNFSAFVSATPSPSPSPTPGPTSFVAGGIDIDVGALGGSATGSGAGGAASGGDASLYVSPDGGLIDLDAAAINANAVGGSSASGTGGSADGGHVSAFAQAGTIRAANGMSVTAVAGAGLGIDGAAAGAIGGDLQFHADGGALEFSTLFADVSAIDFTSTFGYDGGDAIGGIAQVAAANGGSVTIGNLSLSASAHAPGSNAGDGTAGAATGGTVNVFARSNATVDIGTASLAADAFGGGGLVSGFAGGDATAGSVSISQETGGALTVQSANLRADATGGGTIGGSGIGGSGTGGDARFYSNDGNTIATGAVSIRANGQGGPGTTAGGVGKGGFAHIGADSGLTRVDGLATVTAAGRGGDGSGSGNGGMGIGGSALVGTIGAGQIEFGTDLTVQSLANGGSGVDGGQAEGGLAQLFTDNFLGGSVSVAGSALLLASAQGGSGSGGTFGSSTRGASQALVEGGSISVGDLFLNDSGTQPHAADFVSQVRAEQGSIFVSGTLEANVSGDFLLIGAGTSGFIETNDLIINAGNTVLLDDPTASGTAGSDNITVNNNVLANLGGDLLLPVPVEVPGSFTVNAGGSITTGEVLAGGGISLTAGGDLTTGQLGTFGDIDLDAGGSATIGGVLEAVNLFAQADGGIAFSGDAAMSGQALIATPGTATFDGVVAGQNMVVQSSDIEIGASGGLGAAGTSALAIEASDPTGQVAFGGDDTASGYSLGGDEAARLRANTIFFSAETTGETTLTVGSFTLQGSASSNPNLLGSELILYGDRIRVVGDAQIANAGFEDSMVLVTDETLGAGPIEVVTDLGGRLRILAPDGSPTGSLLLDASNIWVGTSSLLDQLSSGVNFSGLQNAVAAPDGTNRPEGNVIAGIIRADGLNSIIIQNSNTASLRGGFTAANHFFIDTQATDPGSVVVAVNGRIGDDSGGFITNEATREAVDFVDPADAELLTSDSTVNGCLLTGGSCSFDSPGHGDEPEPNIAADVREIAEMVEEDHASEEEEEREEGERAAEAAPSEETKKSPIVRPVTIVDTSPLAAEPLIDEPVSGTQNPNFRLDPSSAADATDGAGDQ